MTLTPVELLTHIRQIPDQKVWGYVRTGLPGQRSADEQIEAIRGYCRDTELAEPALILEQADADKPMFHGQLPGLPDEDVETYPRPLLLTLLSFLQSKGEGHTLVLDRLDRLAGQPWEQELLLWFVSKHKVLVQSVLPDDRSVCKWTSLENIERRFFRIAMSAFPFYEKAFLMADRDSGIIAKSARGGFTGGSPPFGYRVENGDLVIDEYEARIIRYIFYLKKKVGYSTAAIADKMWLVVDEDKDDRVYEKTRIARYLTREALYRGKYRDYLLTVHDRPDLKILPDTDEELFDEWDSKLKPTRDRASRDLPREAGG